MKIRCGHCQGFHASVAEVRACSRPAPVVTKPVGRGAFRKDGKIYAVRASRGTGYLYCVQIDGQEETLIKGGRWLLTEADRMTVDEVAALGQVLVKCVLCGTPLENEKSRALGMGPICRGYV